MTHHTLDLSEWSGGCSHDDLCRYLLNHGLVRSWRLVYPTHRLRYILPIQSVLHHTDLDSQSMAVVVYRGVNRNHHQDLSRLRSLAVLVIVSCATDVPDGCSYIEVSCPRSAWALGAKRISGSVSDHMSFCGVTGTNGKTSTVWFCHEILRRYNLAHLLISTYGYKIVTDSYTDDSPFSPTDHTTPDPHVLYRILIQAYQVGVRHVVAEISSHALEQKKLVGISFNQVAWTSFSRDHLDYHQTMDQYFKAKWQLFQDPYSTSKTHHMITQAVCDTPEFQKLVGRDHHVLIMNDGMDSSGDFRRQNLSLAQHLVSDILKKSLSEIRLDVPECSIRSPRGRMEHVHHHPDVYIDYAHTPQALEFALQSLKQSYGYPVWLVFGCGGDRDPHKRPLMMTVACAGADRIFLTSDNPRTEDLQLIIAQMIQSISAHERDKITIIESRKTATYEALSAADRYYKDYSCDVVILIAGKGHETVQIMGDQTYQYSDHDVVAEYYLKNSQKTN